MIHGQKVSFQECLHGIEIAALDLRRQDRLEDYRQHVFRSRKLQAKMVFLRAHTQGSLLSQNDSRIGLYPMGSIWYE